MGLSFIYSCTCTSEIRVLQGKYLYRHINKYIGLYIYFWAYFPYFEQEVLGRTNRLLSLIQHGPHWKRRVQKFFHCWGVFVNAVTFLPSRCPATIGGLLPGHCLATIGGILPSRCLATIEDTHARARSHTQTATWSHKPTLFFQNRKVG
jgi:hypothetical protein